MAEVAFVTCHCGQFWSNNPEGRKSRRAHVKRALKELQRILEEAV